MTDELQEQLQDSLGDLYVLERELAGGGMSRVFVALDAILGRRIVVKVLPPELAADVNIERFRREILLFASLLHPHIIPLLSAGEACGLPYYTMPYVDSESLRLRLAQDGQLAISQAIEWGSEVAGALDYAHRRGIVHRDMKPENVLLQDNHALVTDFGIARAISAAGRQALTSVGIAVGTPAYMSPEQARGDRDIDGRSDTYALGCMVFEMLTGRPPFLGPNALSVMMQHANEAVPPLRDLRPDVPLHVERAVSRALAKDADARFASALDFATALQSHTPGSLAALRTAESPSGSHRRPPRFLAVLPFANLSPDPENEYFSDGMTEDIIAQLSKVRGLRVLSRTSTLRYKNRPESVRDIGRELGVSHILEGSVRRSGSRLRIVAQLIDACNDEHVWAETFNRELTDVFAIQAEVAEHISAKLDAHLSPSERSRLARKPTDDMEAYTLYLLGRHHYNKVTAADFAKAVDYYRQAVARDPNFARAYAALGEAQMYLGGGYWGIRPRDAFPEGFDNVSKALALDPNSAEAMSYQGLYYHWIEHRWDLAGELLRRAVLLNESAPLLRVYYAMHLCGMGQFREALVQRDVANQLDPTAMAVRGNTAWLLYLARQGDAAIAEGRALRQIEPSSPYAAFSHGLVCAQGGDPQEAIAAFRDAATLSGGASLYLTTLAYGLAVGGEDAEARAILDDLHARESQEFVWPMGMGLAYAHLREPDRAMDLLERAYEERVGWMALLGREPAADILRGVPRFEALLKKIGPPPELLQDTDSLRPSPLR
ncbi:MAG: protein kinase [Gemmatimonadaceae bacterium]